MNSAIIVMILLLVIARCHIACVLHTQAHLSMSQGNAVAVFLLHRQPYKIALSFAKLALQVTKVSARLGNTGKKERDWQVRPIVRP